MSIVQIKSMITAIERDPFGGSRITDIFPGLADKDVLIRMLGESRYSMYLAQHAIEET